MDIITQRIPHQANLPSGLGRHVEHDPRSWNYAFSTSLSKPLQSVMHERKIPILDQGQLGSCTGNAGTGLLGTEPFYSSPTVRGLQLDETFAVQLYSDATAADSFPGKYPPDDTGSSGLAIGRVLKKRGDIKSYVHAFGLLHALQALQKVPEIIGIRWYNRMFDPDSSGIVKVDLLSGLAGGHEIEVVGTEVTDPDPNHPKGYIRFANSWNTSWGDQGYGLMSFDDFALLLKQGGDVMTFTVKS